MKKIAHPGKNCILQQKMYNNMCWVDARAAANIGAMSATHITTA